MKPLDAGFAGGFCSAESAASGFFTSPVVSAAPALSLCVEVDSDGLSGSPPVCCSDFFGSSVPVGVSGSKAGKRDAESLPPLVRGLSSAESSIVNSASPSFSDVIVVENNLPSSLCFLISASFDISPFESSLDVAWFVVASSPLGFVSAFAVVLSVVPFEAEEEEGDVTGRELRLLPKRFVFTLEKSMGDVVGTFTLVEIELNAEKSFEPLDPVGVEAAAVVLAAVVGVDGVPELSDEPCSDATTGVVAVEEVVG